LADSPAAIRQWFPSLMQPDNSTVSRCGEADAFEVDMFEVEGDHYVAVVTHGKGVIPNGTRIPVPNSNVKSIFHVGSKFESTRAVAGIALTDQTAIAAIFVELVRDQDARHGNLKSSA
jgi:hypothetical protein